MLRAQIKFFLKRKFWLKFRSTGLKVIDHFPRNPGLVPINESSVLKIILTF